MVELIWTQMRVIAALTLRETRMTFGTSQVGYLWAIIQPLFSISFLVFIFYLIGRHSPFGPSLALFFSTAILILEYYNKLSVSLMRAFTSNVSLLTYPMIKETDTLFARFILITMTLTVISVLFYGALIGLGFAEPPAHPIKIVAAFFATGFFGFGIGTMNAVIYTSFPSWQHVEKSLGRPLFFLSGVFYIPSSMPPEAIAVLKWNPIIHLVELNREGFYQNYQSDVLNIGYPLGLAAGLVALGLFWERITRKKRV